MPATRSGPTPRCSGLRLLWIAAILTLYTGYDYLLAVVRHVMTDEDVAHDAAALFRLGREKVGNRRGGSSCRARSATVAELITWLKTRGPEFADAFARAEVSARPSTGATFATTRASARPREIAFFPPVTGG